MSLSNKAILQEGNAAIARGDNEGFLAFCADDTEWTFVGDKTLRGKQAVRQWMETTYLQPPDFEVADLVAEGDLLVASGSLSVKDKDGKEARSSYCDIWRFSGGKIVALKAFVVTVKAT